jgi:amino acid adenylation domain-containing protein
VNTNDYQMFLDSRLALQARANPHATALEVDGQVFSYCALETMVLHYQEQLHELGVSRGSRVVVWSAKSATAIAVFQAVMRLGGAYVPIDGSSPLGRVLAVAADCCVDVMIVDEDREVEVKAVINTPVISLRPASLFLDVPPTKRVQRTDSQIQFLYPDESRTSEDIAYVLYTSGSTGKPKGVAISHRAALSFVDWSVTELDITAADRLANHAPFHFDLSVLDLYCAFSVGAAVVVVPKLLSFAPTALCEFIVDAQISVWYSVPTVLVLLINGSDFLTNAVVGLRVIAFAGEPFPIEAAKALRRSCQARLINLYGPTETNVITFFEMTDADLDRESDLPIGWLCPGTQGRVGGKPVESGAKGELVVRGPTLMRGYLGRADVGEWYNTGDMVEVGSSGELLYRGRSDNMVKIRGHRIEPGEVSETLQRHPNVELACVVVVGEATSARLVAAVVTKTDKRLGLLEAKAFLAETLPPYMNVDGVVELTEMPVTSNGKIDRKVVLGLVHDVTTAVAS